MVWSTLPSSSAMQFAAFSFNEQWIISGMVLKGSKVKALFRQKTKAEPTRQEVVGGLWGSSAVLLLGVTLCWTFLLLATSCQLPDAVPFLWYAEATGLDCKLLGFKRFPAALSLSVLKSALLKKYPCLNRAPYRPYRLTAAWLNRQTFQCHSCNVPRKS